VEPVDALYFHVPFCVKKCGYCDFVSRPLHTCGPEATARFAERIVKESALYPGNRYDTIYFGGGTPSLLTPDEVATILDATDIASGAEITLEVNPGTVDLQKLVAFRQAGITRLSLGIQSLDDNLLRMLGRIHSAAEALQAYETAREAGFENVSLDMMFALPGQTLAGLEADLKAFFKLSPEHLSLYALSWEQGTPFWEKRRRGELIPCENETEALMFEMIMDYADGCGYRHYEISNFAREGFFSRHNLKYWRNRPYVGLGPAAAGYVGEIRYKNIREFAGWSAIVESGRRPRDEAEIVRVTDPLELEQYRAMLNLRLLIEGYEPLLPEFRERCRDLSARGLLSEKQGRYTLTKRGLMIASDVTEEFL